MANRNKYRNYVYLDKVSYERLKMFKGELSKPISDILTVLIETHTTGNYFNNLFLDVPVRNTHTLISKKAYDYINEICESSYAVKKIIEDRFLSENNYQEKYKIYRNSLIHKTRPDRMRSLAVSGMILPYDENVLLSKLKKHFAEVDNG